MEPPDAVVVAVCAAMPVQVTSVRLRSAAGARSFFGTNDVAFPLAPMVNRVPQMSRTNRSAWSIERSRSRSITPRRDASRAVEITRSWSQRA